jgi:hypothetical protein
MPVRNTCTVPETLRGCQIFQHKVCYVVLLYCPGSPDHALRSFASSTNSAPAEPRRLWCWYVTSLSQSAALPSPSMLNSNTFHTSHQQALVCRANLRQASTMCSTLTCTDSSGPCESRCSDCHHSPRVSYSSCIWTECHSLRQWRSFCS